MSIEASSYSSFGLIERPMVAYNFTAFNAVKKCRDSTQGESQWVEPTLCDTAIIELGISKEQNKNIPLLTVNE